MTIENEEIIAFLMELHRVTAGDMSAKASMHAVGAAIGMDKVHAGKVAEELIGKGWVEVKTLSGGIGITAEGLEAAVAAGAISPAGSDPVLGSGPLLDAADRQVVTALLEQIRTAVADLRSDYPALEEMVLDIKTLEVHLLSPKAKTSVTRAVLEGLQNALSKAGGKEIAARVKRTMGAA